MVSPANNEDNDTGHVELMFPEKVKAFIFHCWIKDMHLAVIWSDLNGNTNLQAKSPYLFPN